MNKGKTPEISPALQRHFDEARMFLARMKRRETIPLRTLTAEGKRLGALHKKLGSLKGPEMPEIAAVKKDIAEALRTIARSKIRQEWRRKIKKNVRLSGDSSLHKQRVYRTLQAAKRR